MISIMHFVGMLVTLAITIGVSIYSGRTVKNSADFDTGNHKAGAAVVAGAFIGTLVGGSSTIGTAQLAYLYGFSAWWYTLSSGISALLIALFCVRPYRNSDCDTLLGLLAKEYGQKMDRICAILSSLSIFIAIMVQLMSSTTILAALFPKITDTAAVLVTAGLMLAYIIFGGALGVGMVGIVKTILLYVTMIACGVMALHLSGGMRPLLTELDHSQYFNLFARGVGVDVGAALSVLFGVLSTQSYYQILRSGRTEKEARRGAVIGACMVPPVGIGGILVGLYMRVTRPGITETKMILPMFVLEYMPPLLAGIIFAGLLITLVGAGAGVSIGVSNVIKNDIVYPLLKKEVHKEESLWISRGSVVLILAIPSIICLCPIGDMLLNFSFLSMALRSAVVFVPLMFAMIFPGKVRSKYAMAAAVAGPISIIILELFADLPFDPLFVGIGLAVVLCCAGWKRGNKKEV